MAKCPHFEIWCRQVLRRTHAQQAGESHHVIKVAYCTHSESPVPLQAAQQSLGDGSLLKCAGYVRRCPLPEGIRPQPNPRSQLLSDFDRPDPLELQLSNVPRAGRD